MTNGWTKERRARRAERNFEAYSIDGWILFVVLAILKSRAGEEHE